MTSILVTVWPNRSVIGFNGKNDADIVAYPSITLEEALSTNWDTDAHCVPYTVKNTPEIPRINKEALAENKDLVLDYNSAWYDIDAPKVVKNMGREWINAWIDEQWNIFREHYANFGGYKTLNGFRIIIPIEATHQNYSIGWRAGFDELSTKFKVDELKDIGRCYRLPNVIRNDTKFTGVCRSEIVLPIAEPRKISSKRLPAVVGKARTVVPETITNNRNETLFGIGGALRRMGFSEDSVLACLKVTNSEICAPPLEDGELQVLVAKVSKYDRGSLIKTSGVRPGDGLELDLGSEAEMADWVLRQLEIEGWRCVWDQSKLRVYRDSKGYWIDLDENTVADMILKLDGAWKGNGKKRGKISISERMVKGVYSLICRKRSIPGHFSEGTPGIVFADKIRVGLDEKPVACHAKFKDLWCLKESFKDWEGVKPHLFLSFLDDAFGQLVDGAARIQIIREFIGACLLGVAPDYQKAMLFTGRGANGKSVLLKVIEAMFPEEGRASIAPQFFDQEYYRANLVGKNINVVSEVPEVDMLATESFRALVTGDTVAGREPYGKPFSFRSRAGQIFAANSLPGVRDLSEAFWRRWIVVDWPRIIPLNLRDERLGDKLVSCELGGVILWALEGGRALINRGAYCIPKSSLEALEGWRGGSDQIVLFAQEEILGAPGDFLGGGEIYRKYHVWANVNGFGKMNRGKLMKRLELLGYKKDRKSKERGLIIPEIPKMLET